MAVVIENDSGATPLEDTNSYTVVGTGSNRLLLAATLMSDNGTGGTLSTHTLNLASFDSDTLAEAGTGSPYIYGLHGHFLDGNATTGAHTFTTSTAWANSGTYIAELSGVDQTTPISFSEVLKGEPSTSVTHTISYAAGDLIVLMFTSSQVLSSLANLDGTDAWTSEISADAGLVGGTLDKGYVRTVVASGSGSSVTVIPTIASAADLGSMIIVVAADTGATITEESWTGANRGVGRGIARGVG